jgi:hypothetical protein
VKPLAIDLFCGLGGWTEGLLAEDYRVVGFDTERHDYWHGTEGVEIPETEPAMHECNDCGILTEKYRPICTLCERWYEANGIKPFKEAK